MTNTTDRLELCAAILSIIEQKRAETGDETLGWGIERVVLDTRLQELQQEALKDQLDPWLIRRRGEA